MSTRKKEEGSVEAPVGIDGESFQALSDSSILVERLKNQWIKKRDKAKEAKQEYDSALDDQVNMVRNFTQGAPLFDQEPSVPMPSAADDDGGED